MYMQKKILQSITMLFRIQIYYVNCIRNNFSIKTKYLIILIPYTPFASTSFFNPGIPDFGEYIAF